MVWYGTAGHGMVGQGRVWYVEERLFVDDFAACLAHEAVRVVVVPERLVCVHAAAKERSEKSMTTAMSAFLSLFLSPFLSCFFLFLSQSLYIALYFILGFAVRVMIWSVF